MPEIAFNGLFKVIALRLVTPGNFYLGFRSKVSGRLFAILDEPTGTGAVGIAGDGTFEVQTPDTGSIERFTAAEMRVFQAATAMLEEPIADAK